MLIAAFAALTWLDIQLFGRIPRRSDFAGSYLAGWDMAHGHWRLAGWWLPTDSFWTSDLLLYALMGLAFGLQLGVLVWLPAALWAGLTMLACWTALKGPARSGRAWALACVLTLLGLPIFDHNPALEQIAFAPMHVATLILALMMFVAAEAAMRPDARAWPSLAGLCVATLLAAAGDPLAVVVGVLPVLAAAGLSRAWPARRRLAVALTVLVGWAAAAGLLSLLQATIVPADALSLGFAAYPQAIANVGSVFQNLFAVFGASFFDARVADALPQLARLPLLLAAALAVAVVVRWTAAQVSKPFAAAVLQLAAPRPLDVMLASGVILDLAAIVLGRTIIDVFAAGRYLLPTLVFGAILAGRLGGRERWAGLAASIAVGLSIFSVAGHYVDGPRRVVWTAPRIRTLALWLEDHRLGAGYGPSEDASVVTVLTGGAVAVRPVVRGGAQGLAPLRRLTSAAWYPAGFAASKPRFVVIDPTSSAFDAANVAVTFGPPRSTASVAGFTVDLY